MQHSIERNIYNMKTISKPKKKEQLNNTDYMLYYTLCLLIKELKLPYEVALQNILSGRSDKDQKARLKTKLNHIYLEHIKGEDFEVQTNGINKLLSDIGIKL